MTIPTVKPKATSRFFQSLGLVLLGLAQGFELSKLSTICKAIRPRLSVVTVVAQL